MRMIITVSLIFLFFFSNVAIGTDWLSILGGVSKGLLAVEDRRREEERERAKDRIALQKRYEAVKAEQEAKKRSKIKEMSSSLIEQVLNEPDYTILLHHASGRVWRLDFDKYGDASWVKLDLPEKEPGDNK